MSEFEPDRGATEVDMPDTDPAPLDAAATAHRRLPWWMKVLIGLGVVVALLVGAALLLYNFGGMEGSEFDPEIGERYEQMVAAGEVEPVEQRFVIGIPGCTCHSEDPYLTEQHRNRRMAQCKECHQRVGPQ